MGSVTAKIMRDAKEARKMGDAGAGVGGDTGGTGLGLAEATAMSQAEAEGLGAFNAPAVDATTSMAQAEAEGLGAYGAAPGLPAGSTSNVGTPTGDVSPVGGAGHEQIPTPKAWEATAEKAAEKGEQKAEITRKKRRRSLLTEEEGGILGTSPVYRRSILGR